MLLFEYVHEHTITHTHTTYLESIEWYEVCSSGFPLFLLHFLSWQRPLLGSFYHALELALQFGTLPVNAHRMKNVIYKLAYQRNLELVGTCWLNFAHTCDWAGPSWEGCKRTGRVFLFSSHLPFLSEEWRMKEQILWIAVSDEHPISIKWRPAANVSTHCRTHLWLIVHSGVSAASQGSVDTWAPGWVRRKHQYISMMCRFLAKLSRC